MTSPKEQAIIFKMWLLFRDAIELQHILTPKSYKLFDDFQDYLKGVLIKDHKKRK